MNGAAFEKSPIPPVKITTFSIMAASQALIGCGVGVLIANKLPKGAFKKSVGSALITVGVLANLPGIIGYILHLVNSPESSRGAAKRLRSIRRDVDSTYKPDYEFY